MKAMRTDTVRFRTNGGRFHFDPGFDPSRTPTWRNFQAALEEHVGRRDVAVGRAFEEMLACLVRPRSLGAAFMALIPGDRRRVRRNATARIMTAMRVEMRRLHDLMREYGFDIAEDEDMLARAKVIMTMAVYLVGLRAASERKGLGATERGEFSTAEQLVECMEGLEQQHAALREIVEVEAMKNLLATGGVEKDPARVIAMLRSAEECVRSRNVMISLRTCLAEAERRRG